MNKLPLFADGIHLSEKELLATQDLARALPDRPSRARAAQAGHRASIIKGRGMEFAEVRHYQQGDDIRTIDWRVTARTGKAHTKLFVEERERPVIILLDLSHSLYFGSSLLLQAVQAAHLASTLGWQAVRHGDRLGALIACEHEHLELKPRSRHTGILQLIQGICRTHSHQLNNFSKGSGDGQHWLRACQRLARIAKPGSLVWLITDGSAVNADCLAPLSALKRHCELGAFLMTDPLRTGELPLPADIQLPVREAGVDTMLDRAGYHNWLAREAQRRDEFCRLMTSLGVQTRSISAGNTLQSQLEVLR
ncbi:DUF58 domain-containing protein [Shewanella cyperi]|uniref:DUF58 domain-containing protein n=1 Tax=Shewanella cyperi TaxID=2814292 RepID=UPI001A952BE0|nr:DUF58 domain-containing protein [Shewanella cyperi]QSX39579.1 DUF58 domain-containing protein [Shewanella cyperi]